MRASPLHDQGLFADEAIPRGARIVEYVGNILGPEEGQRELARQLAAGRLYLYRLGDGRSLDGAPYDNVARYSNHSCAPNCDSVIEDGRVWIHALRDIAPGEELTHDYEMGAPDPCHCGAPNCRSRAGPTALA